jgi:hypothetical protein
MESKGTKIKTHLLAFTLGVIVAWGRGTNAYICFFPCALYNASGNRRQFLST